MAAGRRPVLKLLGWVGKGLGWIVYTPRGPNLTPKNSWPPPGGGTETVFECFLSPGGSVWADSFWIESEISCPKCRHPTKGFVKKTFGPNKNHTPPKKNAPQKKNSKKLLLAHSTRNPEIRREM
jgi:hypothetical protein